MRRAPRLLAPLNPNRVSPVRLWPRTRPINRHLVERALRVAAFGGHTCRPFAVTLRAAAGLPERGEAGQ